MSQQMDLEVYVSLKASHSLPGFDTPHFHIWKLAACFTSGYPLKSDRILDLVYLQDHLLAIIQPLEGTYLNDTVKFSPTSENIVAWVWDQVTTRLKKDLQAGAKLKYIRATICDLEGQPLGAATLRE